MAPIVLIFGSSHVGKSTLARWLAERSGWQVHPTDMMGRHPGRPWPHVRDPVAEHYARLSDETIYWFLKTYQDNMWPYVRLQVQDAAQKGDKAIFEGAALRPEFIATLECLPIVPVGLYADNAVLGERMRAGSDYERQDADKRLLIDRFITRSLRQNDDFLESANRLGLPMIDSGDPTAFSQQREKLIGALDGGD